MDTPLPELITGCDYIADIEIECAELDLTNATCSGVIKRNYSDPQTLAIIPQTEYLDGKFQIRVSSDITAKIPIPPANSHHRRTVTYWYAINLVLPEEPIRKIRIAQGPIVVGP